LSTVNESDSGPYLSVVATARNDNHGGDLLYRMQMFVDGLVGQCERHGLDAELIVVEWNPPLDSPRLADALRLPVSRACPIRIIEVPASLHAQLEHADRLPLFQMIAKNVGIRRARGRFVLATNVDVLLSDKLVAFLARKTLDPTRVYRCDRYDVTADIPSDAPLDEQLQLCDERVIRVNQRDGTVDLQKGVYYPIYARRRRLPWWLALTLYAFEFAWGRFKSLVRRGISFVRHPTKPALRRLETGTLELEGNFWERWQARFAGVRSRIAVMRKHWVYEQNARLRLHTNASGDFTMMSREAWSSLQGYAEFELFSMHIDGLLLYQAHWAHIRERRLPYRIYHLDHASGFKFEPEDLEALNARLERAAVPQVTMEQFMRWATTMAQEKQPIRFNDADWGLARESLAESTTAPALEPAEQVAHV
jgi:hypothetical protein